MLMSAWQSEMGSHNLIDNGLSPENYRRRVLEVIGEIVYLSKLAEHDLSGWPKPLKKMDDLCSRGMAIRKKGQNGIYYIVESEVKKKRKTDPSYRIMVKFGALVFPRPAVVSIWPKIDLVANITMVDLLDMNNVRVRFVGKTFTSWLVTRTNGDL